MHAAKPRFALHRAGFLRFAGAALAFAAGALLALASLAALLG